MYRERRNAITEKVLSWADFIKMSSSEKNRNVINLLSKTHMSVFVSFSYRLLSGSWSGNSLLVTVVIL